MLKMSPVKNLGSRLKPSIHTKKSKSNVLKFVKNKTKGININTIKTKF
jgi:hypothetical protein